MVPGIRILLRLTAQIVRAAFFSAFNLLICQSVARNFAGWLTQKPLGQRQATTKLASGKPPAVTAGPDS